MKEYKKYLQTLFESLDDQTLKNLEEEIIQMSNKYFSYLYHAHGKEKFQKEDVIADMEGLVQRVEALLEKADGNENRQLIHNVNWALGILKDRLSLVKEEPEAIAKEKKRRSDLQHWADTGPRAPQSAWD